VWWLVPELFPGWIWNRRGSGCVTVATIPSFITTATDTTGPINPIAGITANVVGIQIITADTITTVTATTATVTGTSTAILGIVPAIRRTAPAVSGITAAGTAVSIPITCSTCAFASTPTLPLLGRCRGVIRI
jgi:hypothetical protein